MTFAGMLNYKEPLPQRPRARGAHRLRHAAGAAGVASAKGEPSERWFGDDENFEVPKDFPFKNVSVSKEVMELDPLTSKVLEDELQNIMIKIWQALPDEAPTEAEQVVADRLRNEAGDELRNMLGLNVTKRLLNTFNPLMVKVDFNEKPDGDSFRSFLKWLGCVAMKRVRPGAGGAGQHTYVAQLRKVVDFDRVCTRANVRIRELKAKITPCYNFTQCPPNLRTVYKEPERRTSRSQSAGETKSDNTQNDSKTKKVEAQTVFKKPAEKPTTNEANTPKAENKPNTPKVQAAKEIEHEFKMPEVPKLVKTATKVNQKAVANVAKTAQAKTAGKPVSICPNVAKTKTAGKPVGTRPDVAKTAQTQATGKPAVTNAPPAKAIVASKVTPTTEVPTKAPAQNAANTNKNVTPKVVTPKTIAKKPVPKPKPAAKKVAPTKITKKPKPRKESDFDELDDEDILALMSNAIVLDECEGSDEDA